MILVSVDCVTKHYGPEAVLDGTTFEVRPGDRVGLVGPNGAGKTTLLRILAGHEEADRGKVELHPSARVGYLEQHPTFAADLTVWEVARSALHELASMAAEAEEVAASISRTADQQKRRQLERRFDHLHIELDRRDGYQLDHKIEQILQGLDFADNTFRQPVSQLSGGQQNRLLLAQLLLAQPDLMLLDEPSNHLDIESTQWLEQYLAQTKQALIVVSHDRYFLDQVTNRTLELFHGTVDSFAGNFSAYWRQKAERLEVQRRTYQRQQEEIAKLQDFVRRHHYGQKHAQAEDRRKKLERIEPVPPPREISAPPMGLSQATRCGDIVLRAEHLTKRYDRTMFEDLTFDILRGERWAVIGPNGSGKTTLLRCLLGQEKLDQGQVILGAGVQIGYFDQQLRCLAPDCPVVDAVRPHDRELDEPARRSLLARFGLTGDTALQQVNSLSGGERNRAALARLAAAGANFVVLDEPTNHLDLWARDALEKSLREFGGTVLLVSHDRYFINRVADHLLVVEPGRFRPFQGSYDMYTHLARQAAETAGPPDTLDQSRSVDEPAGKDTPQTPGDAAATRRKRKFPFRKVHDLEAEIFQHEEQLQLLHQRLTLPEVLRDGPRVKQIHREIQSTRQTLAKLYEHWEEATELNY